MLIVKKLPMKNVREDKSAFFADNGINNKNNAPVENGERVYRTSKNLLKL